ncbi:MAG: transcriptional repressor LexA [Pseudomonadota bacterium]
MSKRFPFSDLRPIDRRALLLIRNRIAHGGAPPSVRELASDLGFSSPRSSADVIDRLIDLGYLRRRADKSLQLLRAPATSPDCDSTIEVPLVGTASCGLPLLVAENIEAMIPVSVALAKPTHSYFLLRATGNSMNSKGIEDGALVLVRQQQTANPSDIVVALVNNEATIKELRRSSDAIILMPHSTNKEHKPIVLRRDFRFQGVVVATLPIINT